MDFKIKCPDDAAKIVIENKKETDGILFLDVRMTYEKEQIPSSFTVSWKFPVIDCFSTWSPSFGSSHQLLPNWSRQKTHSRLASAMPLHQIVSLGGKNRLCISLSDAVTPTTISTGVCEEDACIDCDVTFFTVPVAPLSEYRATLRLDTRDIPYYDSLYSTSYWWKEQCGYKGMKVPDSARMPINSLWYSYHQMLDVEDILKECKLSKPLGMDTVIIDDGWETDDTNRGFAFCGDWEVASSKIYDMKDFIRRIHETGMKVMLWYGVPNMGLHSKNHEEYKDMLLDCSGNNRDFWALDPRYKKVREFLINTYAKAVSEWKLDGLKLDFIDAFVLRGKSLEYDERRDFQSLEEAIDILMTGVTQRLSEINPDIMLEFRQTYVGPAIRKYGNMFRVADCPNDSIVNRNEIVNLRYTSCETAVHSDMLMWNYEEPVESAALQIANVIYSVPQVSVKIAKLPEDHKKMLTFYLDFWRKNREILLDGKLTAENPETNYSKVCAKKDGKAIVSCYTNNVCDFSELSDLTVVNASSQNSVIIKNAEGAAWVTVNCMGEELDRGKIQSPLYEIKVPCAGMIFIKK